MQVEDEYGIVYKLNENELTASVVKLTNYRPNICIPRSVENSNQKYKIISIEEYAINSIKSFAPISVTFAEDSEIKTIKSSAFHGKIKEIHLPASVENIEEAAFPFNEKSSNEISIYISPDNHLFSTPDNKYIFGKSQKDLDYFDTLVYVTPDIKDALIPSNIKIIKPYALSSCQSLKFSDNSQLETIEGHQSLRLYKISIPPNLKNFDDELFGRIEEIDLSPQNQLFQIYDKNYLLKKSDVKSDIYDELVWVNRKHIECTIPSYIKKIYPYAIRNISSIIFEENSKIEVIDTDFIPVSHYLENIVFPASVKVLKYHSIGDCEQLTSIIFQSEEITLESEALDMYSNNYCCLQFPNAKKICCDCWIPEGYVIRVRSDAELSGYLFTEEKFEPKFYDDVSISQKKLDQLFEYVRSLEKKLSKYEEVAPFDLNSLLNKKVQNNTE